MYMLNINLKRNVDVRRERGSGGGRGTVLVSTLEIKRTGECDGVCVCCSDRNESCSKNVFNIKCMRGQINVSDSQPIKLP